MNERVNLPLTLEIALTLEIGGKDGKNEGRRRKKKERKR